MLAQQLPRLAPLLTPDSVFFAVVPVAFGLLNDPVAVVRERTFEVKAGRADNVSRVGTNQGSRFCMVQVLPRQTQYYCRLSDLCDIQ